MPPAASKARSMAVMAGLGCNHDRDCAPITNVLQATCQITYVKTIAERLKSAREDLGLSQGELAKRAGVSQSTIANFEAGTRHSPRKLLAIAAALRVDPNWLETGKGSREPQAGARVSADTTLDDVLDRLGIELAAVPPDDREAVATNLAGWARSGGRETWRGVVHALLDASSRKRQART